MSWTYLNLSEPPTLNSVLDAWYPPCCDSESYQPPKNSSSPFSCHLAANSARGELHLACPWSSSSSGTRNLRKTADETKDRQVAWNGNKLLGVKDSFSLFSKLKIHWVGFFLVIACLQKLLSRKQPSNKRKAAQGNMIHLHGDRQKHYECDKLVSKQHSGMHWQGQAQKECGAQQPGHILSVVTEKDLKPKNHGEEDDFSIQMTKPPPCWPEAADASSLEWCAAPPSRVAVAPQRTAKGPVVKLVGHSNW